MDGIQLSAFTDMGDYSRCRFVAAIFEVRDAIHGGPSPAAAIVFTVLVALILVTPISLGVYTIAQQSELLLEWFKQAREGGIDVPDWVARLPIAAESTQQWWRANLSDPKAATAWLKTLNADNVSDLFTTLGGQLIHRLFLLFFSLLALFALLRNGRAVASRVLETCDRLFGEAGRGPCRENGRCDASDR